MAVQLCDYTVQTCENDVHPVKTSELANALLKGGGAS